MASGRTQDGATVNITAYVPKHGQLQAVFWLARRKRVPAEKNARGKKPFQRADGGTVARRRNTKG